VSSLPNLQHLRIQGSRLNRDGFGSLAKLSGNLRSLGLDQCQHLPACLPALTGLTALRLVSQNIELLHGDKLVVEAACSSLPGLAQVELDIPYLPGQLTSLSAVTAL
jgi:hypothetical protein